MIVIDSHNSRRFRTKFSIKCDRYKKFRETFNLPCKNNGYDFWHHFLHDRFSRHTRVHAHKIHTTIQYHFLTTTINNNSQNDDRFRTVVRAVFR